MAYFWKAHPGSSTYYLLSNTYSSFRSLSLKYYFILNFIHSYSPYDLAILSSSDCCDSNVLSNTWNRKIHFIFFWYFCSQPISDSSFLTKILNYRELSCISWLSHSVLCYNMLIFMKASFGCYHNHGFASGLKNHYTFTLVGSE